MAVPAGGRHSARGAASAVCILGCTIGAQAQEKKRTTEKTTKTETVERNDKETKKTTTTVTRKEDTTVVTRKVQIKRDGTPNRKYKN